MRLADRLRGGNPRRLGEADRIAAEVAASRPLLGELCDCLRDSDPVVRMRAADALEKVAREHPDWFTDRVEWLLTDVAAIDQPSVRWHLAQVLAEVPLTTPQRRRAIALLRGVLETDSDWIVLTCTMTSVTTLVLADRRPAAWLDAALHRHLQDPRPAVAKRAARQLDRLGQVEAAWPASSTDRAASSRATGTRNGEQDT